MEHVISSNPMQQPRVTTIAEKRPPLAVRAIRKLGDLTVSTLASLHFYDDEHADTVRSSNRRLYRRGLLTAAAGVSAVALLVPEAIDFAVVTEDCKTLTITPQDDNLREAARTAYPTGPINDVVQEAKAQNGFTDLVHVDDTFNVCRES